MESDVDGESEELTPAESLASAKAARERLARRVKVPWVWDAFQAVGAGAVVGLVMWSPSLGFLGAAFYFTFRWLSSARQRRVGVVSEGTTRRTFDPLQLWMILAVLATFATGFAVRTRWAATPLVAAVFIAAVVFLGSRWINRRAIARIRSAS
ncbi:hypothetical protein [Demequina lutea]|uniref:Uncharacterized protein n=1 Tax=Demequina lutea TaxID=431489 RepID=A0A7Y9ZCG4_9MICO|nr:hypothetical protein [Demequina lutea]NYI42576.1 hypothetical protein [Demequina lutea]